MNTKKILVPTIIALITLVSLTVGATYAYFRVTTSKITQTSKISAELDDLGNVALTGKDDISISLTSSDMANKGSDITYYASANGKTTTSTTAIIATATAEGEGTFSCDYSIKIDDNTTSMYDAFQKMSTKSTGQIVLNVNGTSYDFNTSGLFPNTITGTLTGITSANSKNITAQLKIVNKYNVDQSALAGTSLNLTFTVQKFECIVTS